MIVLTFLNQPIVTHGQSNKPAPTVSSPSSTSAFSKLLNDHQSEATIGANRSLVTTGSGSEEDLKEDVRHSKRVFDDEDGVIALQSDPTAYHVLDAILMNTPIEVSDDRIRVVPETPETGRGGISLATGSALTQAHGISVDEITAPPLIEQPGDRPAFHQALGVNMAKRNASEQVPGQRGTSKVFSLGQPQSDIPVPNTVTALRDLGIESVEQDDTNLSGTSLALSFEPDRVHHATTGQPEAKGTMDASYAAMSPADDHYLMDDVHTVDDSYPLESHDADAQTAGIDHNSDANATLRWMSDQRDADLTARHDGSHPPLNATVSESADISAAPKASATTNDLSRGVAGSSIDSDGSMTMVIKPESALNEWTGPMTQGFSDTQVRSIGTYSESSDRATTVPFALDPHGSTGSNDEHRLTSVDQSPLSNRDVIQEGERTAPTEAVDHPQVFSAAATHISSDDHFDLKVHPHQSQLDDDGIEQIVKWIETRIRGEHGEVSLRLHPRHLGELTINISLEQGTVTAQMTAQSAEVKALIEASLPELRSNLVLQGLDVSELAVNVGDGGYFGHQGPQDQVPHEMVEGQSSQGQSVHDRVQAQDVGSDRLAEPRDQDKGIDVWA